MNRRTAVFSTILMVVLLLILGLSDSAHMQGLVEYGGLRYPITAAPVTFDPGDPDFENSFLFVAYQLYESLFISAPDGAIVPAGATGYEVSADGLEYTIHLRPSARWSNNTPVIAQDYIDAMLRLGSTDFASLLYPVSGFEEYSQSNPELVGIMALDDHTILITLDSPAAYFPHVLAAPIVSYPLHESEDVFNGPYIIWTSSPDGLVLVKNPYYWDSNNVHIENIFLPVIPDPAVQFDLYQGDQIDVSGYPTYVLPAILGDPQLRAEFRHLPRAGIYYIGLNTAGNHTDNLSLRKALASAIDRQYIVDQILDRPWRSVATGMIPPELGGSLSGVVGYDFDLDAARAYLAEYTSTPGDVTLEIWYNQGHFDVMDAVATMWQDNLGVNVDLIAFNWIPYLEELRSCASDPGLCTYSGYRMGWLVDYADGWSIFSDMYDRSLNSTGWSSSLYDYYLDAAANQPDPELRLSIYEDAEKLIVEDEAVLIPIFFYDETKMIKSYVNYEYPLDGSNPFLKNWSLLTDNCEANNVYDDACHVTDRLGFSFDGSGSFSSYLSHEADVDWFTFELGPEDIVPGQSLEFTLSGHGGGDLPANFDMAIMAEISEDQTTVPTPLQGVPLQGVPLQGVPLQGVPLQGVDANSVPLQGVPLQGVEVRDIPLQGVPLQGVPLQGVPLQGVPLQGVPLQGVGYHQGVQSEEVLTLFRGGMTGRFYVLVWSTTGEFSTSSYDVTISVAGATAGDCETGVEPAELGQPLPAPLGNSDNPSTLILVNRPRMVALYDQTSTDDLFEKLEAVAGHNTVNGLIVDLAEAVGNEVTYPTLQAAYNEWDQFGCDVTAANIVTREIKKVILEYLLEHESLENLVLVGNDKVIPFRRVPDEIVTTDDGATVPNEFDYQNQIEHNDGISQTIGVVNTKSSPTYAALRLQYFFSDDFYADLAPVLLDHGHELSVPDLPMGRLVEKPAEIVAYLDSFLSNHGVMESGQAGESISSLTTGYSFLTDQAQALEEVFSFNQFQPRATLISDSWNKNDLISVYEAGNADIKAINAHFDHWRAAPALLDDQQGLVLSTELASSGLDLSGTLFFSVGCHMGMNFPDEDALDPGAGALDFSQALLSQGVTAIGNWGFGYGDDAALAYSEELMLGFARHLGESSVGEALMKAKREYLLNQALLDPVHEKVLMEAVFYGLPNWQLNAEVASLPAGNTSNFTSGEIEGLTVRNYTVDMEPMTQVTIPDRGSYYELVPGRTQSALYRPIQPQTSVDVSGETDEVAHGVLFTGGTYNHIASFDPAITMPSWTRTNPEPQFIYEGWDPPRFWSLAQLEQRDGTLEEFLVLVPGQFLADEPATIATGTTTGTQRLYDILNFEVIYSPAALEFQKPIFREVTAALVSNQEVSFGVKVSDPANESTPKEGIVKVLVAYTEIVNGSSWSSIELTYDASNKKWMGTLPATEQIDFFVQAVDASGNVGMFAGNGYFTPISVTVSGPSTAILGLPVGFEATSTDALDDPRYYWDFGDGSSEAGSATVVHSYNRPGNFEVSVRLVDADGNVGEAATVISVNTVYLLTSLAAAVEDLPAEAIQHPAEDRRLTLQVKLAEVGRMILEHSYDDAIQKLTHDIRAKMNGCGDVADHNDWIIDCSWQFYVRNLIDDLIAIVEGLEGSNS